MRADARSLLNRLGRSDFAYKEFADRFSDLELWPLFEALLKDPRLFQEEGLAEVISQPEPARPMEALGIAGARPAGSIERRVSPQRPFADTPARPQSLAEAFHRYEGGETAEMRKADDVRAMLRRLSDLGEQGAL